MERGKNGRAYLWRKTTTHGPRRTIHDGNRQVMLKCSGAKQAFLLSPQSSVLSTHYLSIDPDTRHPKPETTSSAYQPPRSTVSIQSAAI